MHRLPTKPALALLSVLAACGGDSRTAAQLVLTPDPEISTVAQLLDKVARVVLIVDAPEGLVGVDTPGPRADGSEALDWDGDGALEVRFAAPGLGGDALPVLEVGLAGNADRALDFRVLGYSAAERLVAEGGASATIPAGEVRRVGTPFNLNAAALPPRVLIFLPPDGTKIEKPLGGLTALLSTTIDEASLAGHIQVKNPLGEVALLSATAKTVKVSTGPTSPHERSLLTIEMPEMFEEGTYELQVGPGLISAGGVPFDQDSSTAEQEPFVSTLRYDEAAIGGSPLCELCPEGYGCNQEETACIPILGCFWGCPQGMVCSPADEQCLPDCRTNDFCFDTAQRCDADSGLCQ